MTLTIILITLYVLYRIAKRAVTRENDAYREKLRRSDDPVDKTILEVLER